MPNQKYTRKCFGNKLSWICILDIESYGYKNAGISDLIQTFIKSKPYVEKYDMLIIDEYQDIELELAELLKIVKEANPNMQIIAVGDMQQKYMIRQLLMYQNLSMIF